MSIHKCCVCVHIKRNCHVPLGKLLNPFVPQLLHLKSEDNDGDHFGLWDCDD